MSDRPTDSEMLDWLDKAVKDAGYWRDLVLCHDHEDGVWLASIERGNWRGGNALDLSDAPLPCVRSAIAAAMSASPSSSEPTP